MSLYNLLPSQQIAYLSLLRKKAIEEAKRSAGTIPIDPQGRILIDVKLSQAELTSIVPALSPQQNIDLFERESITVSLDINSIDVLKDRFYKELMAALNSIELDKNNDFVALQFSHLPKGSIIALHQELHFHLNLAMRTYQNSIPGLLDLDDELQLAHQRTMRIVNEKVMEAFALAIKKAYRGPDQPMDLSVLNSQLDSARKQITPLAHQVLRQQIQVTTQIRLTSKALPPSLKHTAESLTATGNDLFHTDEESGLVTWIEGSEATSHDRGIAKPLATRSIITHKIDKQSKEIYPHPYPRVQVRVPSLDAKEKNKSEDAHIEDVQNKLTQIASKYMTAIPPVAGDMPSAFVYNLYTSLNHTLDDIRGENQQTSGAKQILLGAHRYNIDALDTGKPLCFVENIPINGFGDYLGYETKGVVLEATLMSDIALLHTLYKTSNNDEKNLIKEIIDQYTSYLTAPGHPQFFYESVEGKEAINLIQKIKDRLEQPCIVPPEDNILGNAATCLRYLVAFDDLHFDKKYAKLMQSLSVFLEPHSIGGCKSANERAQSINGRVAVFDSLLLTPVNEYTPEQIYLMQALNKFGNNPNGEHADLLKTALDRAFNKSGLQTALTLISLVDQGAGAKAQVKEHGIQSLNGNKFEEEELTNYRQSKTSDMQAHKKLTKYMKKACSEKLAIKAQIPGEEAELQVKLSAQIGTYAGQDNEIFVTDRLVSKEAQNLLYSGIDNYQKQHFNKIKKYCKKHKIDIPGEDDPEFFRKLFIQYCLERDLETFDTTHGDTRADKPKEATKSLVGLFGEDGGELYKLAVEEERYSKDYMDQVFRNSTTHFEGEKWAERPVVIVAGPSASGKSYAAQAAVKSAGQFLPKIKSEVGIEPPGNDVVFVDGGICREVSQMRKLAIRIANRQGFTGISDLHGQSEVLGNAKGCIEKAVFATPTLGVGIPETFSDFRKIKKLHKQVTALPHTKVVFSRVDGADPEKFRKVVAFMGSRRAWKTKGFDVPQDKIDLNSPDDLAESKAYGKSGFYWGCRFSKDAQEYFQEHDPDLISLVITNDMILLKPNPIARADAPKSDQWLDAEDGDEGVIKVSETVYNAWLSNKENHDNLIDYMKAHPVTLIDTAAELGIAQTLALIANLEKIEIDPTNRNCLREARSAIPSKENCRDRDNLHQALEEIESLMKNQSFNNASAPTRTAIEDLHRYLEQRFREVEIIQAIESYQNPKEIVEKQKKEWEELREEQQEYLDTFSEHQNALSLLVHSIHAVNKLSFTQLNPAFQALTQMSAEMLIIPIHELSQHCDLLIKDFKQHRDVIKQLLEALPKAIDLRGKPYRKEVDEHRQFRRCLRTSPRNA